MNDTEYYQLKTDLAVDNAERFIEEIKVPLLQIEERDYRAKYIHIRRGDFTGLVDLRNLDIRNGILFEDCDFRNGFCISGIKATREQHEKPPIYYSIIFRNCRFDELTEFQGSENKIDHGIEFLNCVFRQRVFLNEIITIKNGIKFSRCTLDEGLASKQP